MNSNFQNATVAIIAIIVFLATFFGSTREQVVVEAKKIVTDSNNINNDYLIGIQSLKNALGAKNLVILDIRDSKEYNAGHIPGAINVSWNQFVDNNSNENSNDNNDDNKNTVQGESNWLSLINKNVLTNQLQDLGITNQSTVVIYGNSNGDDLGELGKFSWMFRMVGIDSKMLNGGYKNWQSQGLKTTKDIPKIEKSNIVIQNFVPVKTMQKADVEKNISKIKILELVNDVKVQNNNVQENNTENQQINSNKTENNAQNIDSKDNVQLKTQKQDTKIDPPVKGVIQIKLSDMLNPNGTIKPVKQLQDLFTSKGINKDDIVLFYNTNKGNLAFLTLMLNMSGYNNVETYNANLKQVASITTKILEAKNTAKEQKNTKVSKTNNDINSSQNNEQNSSSQENSNNN